MKKVKILTEKKGETKDEKKITLQNMPKRLGYGP